ncbi:MAG: hypothetical protein EBX37_14860 [Alphaproteobacteria bacterium]|nr:hypothetical protein [Alphaproteobacteria bacterium]
MDYYFPHAYHYINQYYVYVHQPYVYPQYLRHNFQKWRSIVENLAPNRVNSVITRDADQHRVLLFIVEGIGDVNKFNERIKKLFNCKIVVKSKDTSSIL